MLGLSVVEVVDCTCPNLDWRLDRAELHKGLKEEHLLDTLASGAMICNETKQTSNKQHEKKYLKVKKTRSIQRTQTPPRLSPLTCDVDLLTMSRTLMLSSTM